MNKDMMQIIKERHSVRKYKQIPIKDETKQEILKYMLTLKAESGLDIRFEEKTGKVFGSVLMKFIGWKKPPAAYFAFIGERNPETEEKCGYYGEKLVLYVQSLGLNTCWVGMFNKTETAKSTIITIAVGYGEDNGKDRKSKSISRVSQYNGDAPKWFLRGVEAALLAPTAMNRQAFNIKGDGNNVLIECNNGAFSAIDAGIVKYHFEQGAGPGTFEWVRK